MNKVKLGDLLKIKHGYAFKSENYVDEGEYALVTLANISASNNFQFNKAKTTFYGETFPDDFILNEDDMIMPLTEQVVGLFGNSAFVPKIDEISSYFISSKYFITNTKRCLLGKLFTAS